MMLCLGYYAALVAMKQPKTVRFKEPLVEKREPKKEPAIKATQDVFHLARTKSTLCIRLLAPYINLNAQEESTGNTILHYGVLLSDENTITMLLSINKNINVYIKNDCGHTALQLAHQSGNHTIYELLKKYATQQTEDKPCIVKIY